MTMTNYEEDVDWYTGDCHDDLDDSAYTAGTPTDDPELLEQFDGNLEDADASVSQVYASASRSFQDARELLTRVKVPEANFPVVGIGAFDGLAQPSTDRKTVKSRGNGKKGKRKGKSSSQKGGKPTSLGTPGILPKTQSSRVESRPPKTKKCPTEVGATRGGPHHARRLRPDQSMLCRQMGHRASECPNKGKTTSFSPGKREFGTYALGCAVFDSQCYGATVEEIEQDQHEEDIEDFVAFSIKSLEGFAILDGGATKTVSGFMSVRPVADRYEAPRVRRQILALRSLSAKREAASTKICIPHAEFPQGISLNVVSNESTLFLIGLDVLREYGLVIHFHYNRVYSHILKRYLACAILPTGHLAFEQVNRDSTQWRVMPSRLDNLSHPYFIFMTRSPNTSTDALLRARMI